MANHLLIMSLSLVFCLVYFFMFVCGLPQLCVCILFTVCLFSFCCFRNFVFSSSLISLYCLLFLPSYVFPFTVHLCIYLIILSTLSHHILKLPRILASNAYPIFFSCPPPLVLLFLLLSSILLLTSSPFPIFRYLSNNSHLLP